MAINPNEDLPNRNTLAIGMSGSGKTHFIASHPAVAGRNKRVLVWDAYESHKAEYCRDIATFARKVAAAIKKKGGFRIGLSVNPSPENFDKFAEIVWIALDGNVDTAVIIEEYADVSSASKSTPYADRLSRIGRKYGAILLVASQRPQGIDKTLFTQCDRKWVGLTSDYDKNYVERNTGLKKGDLSTIKPRTYECFYIQDGEIQRGGPRKKLRIN